MAQRTIGIHIWTIGTLFFCAQIFKGYTQTECRTAASNAQKPVATMCYDSVTYGSSVVLDVFQAHLSSTNPCNCSVTVSQSVTLSFSALNQLQPGTSNTQCNTNLNLQAGSNAINFNCFVFGSLPVQQGQEMKITLNKPVFTYDAKYCLQMDSADNSSTIITVKCEGAYMPGGTSGTLPPTMAPTTTLTTTTPKTTTIKTSNRQTTTSATMQATTSLATSTLRPTDADQTSTKASPTSRESTTKMTSQSSILVKQESDIPVEIIIPVCGVGVILIIAGIISCCYVKRKQSQPYDSNTIPKPSPHINQWYPTDNHAMVVKDNTVYRIPVTPEEKEIKRKELFKADKIYDERQMNVIFLDEMKNGTDDQNQGTFIRHSVRQVDNGDVVKYAEVDKSLNHSENKNSNMLY